MTYQRDPLSFSGAAHRAIEAVGCKRLAARLGLSESRLRQVSNPMRPDEFRISDAMAADLAAWRAAGVTPIADEYIRRLRAHGVPVRDHGAGALVRCLKALRGLIDQALAAYGTPGAGDWAGEVAA